MTVLNNRVIMFVFMIAVESNQQPPDKDYLSDRDSLCISCWLSWKEGSTKKKNTEYIFVFFRPDSSLQSLQALPEPVVLSIIYTDTHIKSLTLCGQC